MDQADTTPAVQQYLDELLGIQGSSPAEPVIRALLARSVERLHFLCASLLHRSYPRLVRPPLNLQAEEVLGGVVERLLHALREARPPTVRRFFGLANQHIRWELNDLARRLDRQKRAAALPEDVAAPASSGSGLDENASRMLEAIEKLPEDEREVFGLVRVQEMTHVEVAQMLDISVKTVQRRLNRSLILLAEMLSDANELPGS